MVVEVHAAGPGDESWRSTRFTAKINNLESFVYGHTENMDMPTICWEQGDSIEHSWIKYGADEDVTLVIAKADGTDISSATVYPKNAGYTQRIAHGSLYLKVVPNTSLYVEINGDRKHTLSIIGQRPKPSLPTDYINWPTRELTVSNVDTVNNVITVTDHGIPNGGFQRVALNSTGDLPTTSQGTLEANHELVAVYINQHTLALVANLVPLQFSSAGTGTLKMTLMDDDTGSTIYFGAGIHHIGRGFRVGDNTRLYFDEGSIVVGSLDLRRYAGQSTPSGITQNVVIEGPGILSGHYKRRADIDLSAGQYTALVPYIAIDGRGNDANGNRASTNNRITGTTFFKPPMFTNQGGIGRFDQYSWISPWNFNADGPQPVNEADGELGIVKDCYIFGGDDSLKMMLRPNGPLYATRCTIIQTGNSSIHFGANLYSTWVTDEYSVTVEDIDILWLSLGDSGQEQLIGGGGVQPSLGSRSIIKALADTRDGETPGEPDESSFGQRHVLIKDIRIWDPDTEGRPIVLGNLVHPYSAQVASINDQHGDTGFWVFDNIWLEGTPSRKSYLASHDADNTANNITIRNMTVGGVRVTTENQDTFWDIEPYVYNVTFDTPQVTDPYAGGQ